MDVHHHHEHIAFDRKWKQYLFQFSMLFLAVFLGSLGEYYLEHLIERQRESRYVETLYADLQQDINSCTDNIVSWEALLAKTDTLRFELARSRFRNTAATNFLAFGMRRYKRFLYHDRTISQLKYSGNFRLLHKAAVADSLMQYDSYITSALFEVQDQGSTIYLNINEQINNLFISDVAESLDKNVRKANFDSSMRTDEDFYHSSTNQDKREMLKFYNSLEMYKNNIQSRLFVLRSIKQRAGNLRVLLKEDYDL